MLTISSWRGKAQIPDFCQINRSLGGKSRQDLLGTRIGTSNLSITGARTMGLSVDLTRNRPFSDAVLTNNQHRAITFGDSSDCPSDLGLDGSNKPFRTLRVLDVEFLFHSSKGVQPLLSNAGSKRTVGPEMICSEQCQPGPGHAGMQIFSKQQRFFLFIEGHCDIDFPPEWKRFSTPERSEVLG